MHPNDIHVATHADTSVSATLSSSMTTSTLLRIATAAASSLASQVITSTVSSSLAPPSPSSKPSDDENNGECQLLGPFAVLVQSALGALALLSLVFKRWRERPQRPLKVWAFDASKQVFGSVLLHLANLLMSMFSAGQIQAEITKAAAATVKNTYQPNPCSFYLLNLAIDTTIGIPILIVILRVLSVGASYTPLASPPQSINSGHYGDPPQATWWLKQSMIYFIGLLLMKVCVFFVFQLCPWIVEVGDWALRWTEGNEAIQIAFVMLIFPLIMNALQYYIIDTFIKGKPAKEDDVEGGQEDEQGGLLADESIVHGDSADDDEAHKTQTAHETAKPGGRNNTKEAYGTANHDEQEDAGESSTPGSNAEREAIRDRPRI
jgi:STIMATE family